MQTYRCDTAGEIRELFPGGNMRGGKHSELRSPLFPLALPPFRARIFRAYVVVCVTFLVGRWIRQYRGRQAEPMDEGGRESGPRSGPVPCVFGRRVFVNMIKCVIIMGDMM